jgi:hypothetical protein
MKSPSSSTLNDAPAEMSDRDLLAEYQHSGGESGDAKVEAALA